MRLIDAGVVEQKLKKLQSKSIDNGSLLAGATYQILQWTIDVISHQPTVDPVKRGEWVEDICCDGRFICNSCGNEAYFDLDEGTYILKYILFDYCPFCGAKMGGDKE